jgi:hypothetical protein
VRVQAEAEAHVGPALPAASSRFRTSRTSLDFVTDPLHSCELQTPLRGRLAAAYDARRAQ